MLFRTMTNAELENKAKDYLREYINSRELNGTMKLLEYARKNFRVHAGFLRRSKHVFKDGTVLHIIFSKNYYRNQNGGRTADISMAFFFEVMEQNTGQIGYLMPYLSTGDFTLYTTHCCSRMKERAGKDFFEIMIETGAKSVRTKGNGKVELILGDNQYHAFGFQEGNFLTVATFVTNDMLFSNQEELSKEFRDLHRKYMEAVYVA